MKEFFTLENLTTLGTNLAIICAALVAMFKAFMKKWDELFPDGTGALRGSLKDQAELDAKIIKKLEEAKEIMNADRVQIYDFHNGTHYANGRSAVRISCTYESIRYGTKAFQNTLNGVPISCLPKFITTLLNEEKFVCTDIETIKETCPATYEFKKNMGITAFHDVVFKNEDGEIIGFIAIQYCENKFNTNEDTVSKLVGYIETELNQFMKAQAEKNKRR